MTRKRKGLSLLEILIAITILAMAMGPLYLMFRQAAKVSGDEGRMIQAVFLSQKILEEIKASARRNPAGFFSLPIGTEFSMVRTAAGNGAGGLGQPIEPNNPYFEAFRNFVVRTRSEQTNTGSHLVTVETAWREGGKEKQVKLSGLVDPTPDEFDTDLE